MLCINAKKYQDKNILFIIGADVTEIYSCLYRDGRRVIPETLPVPELEQEIAQADVIYLYEVSPQYRGRLMLLCYSADKEFFFSMRTASIVTTNSKIVRDYDRPVSFHRKSKIFGLRGRIKRGMDIVCSLLALVVLSPLFLAIACAIKLDDGGSILYRQTRCTVGGREFQILKFRSMREDAEQSVGAVIAAQDDDRRTRVGKVLRAYKLDELPQLINILKGEMSIVGPRPERPELLEQALQETPEFILRTRVRAGLTGYAQICGYYNTGFMEKLNWDLLYIEKFSLRLDVKLILMTIPTILRKEINEDNYWESRK